MKAESIKVPSEESLHHRQGVELGIRDDAEEKSALPQRIENDVRVRHRPDGIDLAFVTQGALLERGGPRDRLTGYPENLRPDLADIDLGMHDPGGPFPFLFGPDKAPKGGLEVRGRSRRAVVASGFSPRRGDQERAVKIEHDRTDSIEAGKLRGESRRGDRKRTQALPHQLGERAHPLRRRLSRVGLRNCARTFRVARCPTLPTGLRRTRP